MQVKWTLPRVYYQFLKRYVYRFENNTSSINQRLELIQKWDILKEKNVDEETIVKILGISRASYFRWKKALKQKGALGLQLQSRRPHKFRKSKIPQDLKDAVLTIRKENPTYGKFKIYHILKRDFDFKTSQSTIGRILKELINRKLITKSHSYRQNPKARVFNQHSQRWQYGMKSQKPGSLLQIDHMTVYSQKEGGAFKHFQAYDPVSKYLVCEVFRSATSLCAQKFLDKVIKEMPCEITSIQVDGGSEFRGCFEKACQEKNIPLYVLPPRSPKFNGCVERGNGILKEEFYQVFDIPSNLNELRPMLDDFVYKYNTYRPHGSLQGKTPLAYYIDMFEQSACFLESS